jgi:hypothetical protein
VRVRAGAKKNSFGSTTLVGVPMNKKFKGPLLIKETVFKNLISGPICPWLLNDITLR